MTARVAARRAAVLLLVAIVALILLLTVGSSPAEAAAHDVSVPMAQVSPYQLPQVPGGNTPAGLDLFAPFSRLPLWAQAAIVSAVTTAAFFAVAAVVRWVWRLVSDLSSRTTG